jgi:hypothetical protein
MQRWWPVVLLDVDVKQGNNQGKKHNYSHFSSYTNLSFKNELNTPVIYGNWLGDQC